MANNPNKHTKEHLAEIIRSINLHGQMVPVLINSQKQLITGEGRYLASKQMKCRYIAALTIENLPPEALRAYRIADNQLTRTSQFDFTILQDEFKFLYDFKILGTDLGFSTIQVDKILNYQIVESTQKEKTKAAKEDMANWENKDIPKRVQYGELWRCGDSFVLCANSLDSASFEFLMQGEQAQVVVTDAPYNVPIAGHVCGLGKTKHEEFSMASGEMSPEEFKINFVTPYMQNCIKFA